MKMVEVFRTNVEKKTQSKMLRGILSQAFPSAKVNFDLADRDRVLRVEGENMETLRIMTLVNACGFKCEVLD